jgi:hypothetical protein
MLRDSIMKAFARDEVHVERLFSAWPVDRAGRFRECSVSDILLQLPTKRRQPALRADFSGSSLLAEYMSIFQPDASGPLTRDFCSRPAAASLKHLDTPVSIEKIEQFAFFRRRCFAVVIAASGGS